MVATLHVIPFSHFTEKGMWILDYKGVEYNVQPLRNPADRSEMRELTGGTGSLPVYVYGDTVIGDTTELALAMEKHIPDPPLLPSDRALRTEVLLWEDWADNCVAVHTRRWLFHHLRHRAPDLGKQLFVSAGMPARKVTLMWPVMIRMITKSMGADDEAALVSERNTTHALSILSERLENRRYLVGDRFTLADLSVCALLTPIAIIGKWRDNTAHKRVFDWRESICHEHGRRASPMDPIPDAGERRRRRRSGAPAVA